MSMFTLAISYLTHSDLHWFMGLKFQVPMQYCSLAYWTSNTRHIHNWVFLLWLSLFIPSGANSPLFSNSSFWPGKFIFQRHISLLFHDVHTVFNLSVLCKVEYSTSCITSAFMLASRHPGLEIYCTVSIQYCRLKYTKTRLNMVTWQCMPDIWTNMWLDIQTHVHSFESPQLEDSYIEDLPYCMPTGEYTFPPSP